MDRHCGNCAHYDEGLRKGVCMACRKYDFWIREKETDTDPINSPPHYQHGGIETIDIIRMALTDEQFIGYLKGNILKYRERAQFKGKADEDYKKAKWYYDKLQEVQHGSTRD